MTPAQAYYFGATTTGPSHRSEGKPNEDCWLGSRGSFGTLTVVSDGLGSRGKARRGAHMACRAVVDAVRAWHRCGGGPIGDLLNRIESSWLVRIAPSAAHECAATCLFALAHTSGTLHVAGLGDGAVLVRRHGAAVEWVVGRREAAFLNETAALGGTSTWTHRSFTLRSEDVVVLATDGVSDDLLPERIEAFVDWLVSDFSRLPAQKRWRALQRELNAWPTPHHTDDKTLVVLSLPSEGPL